MASRLPCAGYIFAPITMHQLIERLDKREMQRLIKLEEDRQKARALEQKNKNQQGSGGGMGLGSMGGGMDGMLGGIAR